MHITFNGEEFKAKKVFIKGHGRCLISFDRLEDALFEDGRPVSLEASEINQRVFAYVPDCMQDCSRKEIKKYVESCLFTEPPMDYDKSVSKYGI